jgi:hypothetical protein
MTLQKRVDGLDRWKKLKMELPSHAQEAAAAAAAAASKEGDEVLSSTKSDHQDKGIQDDLLAEPVGAESLQRMSSTTTASDSGGSPRD